MYTIQPSFLLSIPPLAWIILNILTLSGWVLLLRFLLKDEKDFLALGGLLDWVAVILIVAAIVIWGNPTANCDLVAGTTGAAGHIDLFGPVDWAAIPMTGWLALAASTLLYTMATLASNKGIQTVEASERSVINQLSVVWAVLVAAALFAEKVSILQGLGVILVVAGAVLCVYQPGKSRWGLNGVHLIAFAALCFGTASIADKVAVGYFPPLWFALPQFAGPGIVATIWMGKDAFKRMADMWRKYYAPVLLTAVISLTSFLAYLFALQTLPVSQVIPLVNLNVSLTVLAGAYLLHEKEGWPYKLGGALLAFIGASLVMGII